jgi:hypothetical protein
MNRYMLGFLLVCMVLGLWAPTRARRVTGVVTALTIALALFFLFYPNKL